MKELLKTLCDLDGVSGYEDEVRTCIKAHISPHVTELSEDPMGNLIAFKKGTQSRKRPFLVCAHMDEVGFLVRVITEDGLMKITRVGDIDPRIIIGQRMRVADGKVKGITALKAFHLTNPVEREIAPKEHDLSLDIGASSKEEAETYINVGDPVVFDSAAIDFGNNCVRGKAIDDRVGCLIAMKMLEKQLAYDTWFAFTAHKENATRSGPVLARRLDPGVCLCLDAIPAVQHPHVPRNMQITALGSGAAVMIMDGQTLFSRPLRLALCEKATAAGIQWHACATDLTSTDAGGLHIHASGAMTIGLSVPVRYIHAANQVVYIPDIEQTLAFAELAADEMGKCDV